MDAIEFAHQRAGVCMRDGKLHDKSSAALLWNLLILVCRQNGVSESLLVFSGNTTLPSNERRVFVTFIHSCDSHISNVAANSWVGYRRAVDAGLTFRWKLGLGRSHTH